MNAPRDASDDSSMIDVPPPQPWYRRWVPGWRTITVFSVLLLATPMSIRWYRLSWLPDVPLPFDDEAFNVMPLDEDNAFVDFGQAVTMLGPEIMDPEIVNRWDRGLVWSELPENLRHYVVAQRPALELFRQGARRPTACYRPPKSALWWMSPTGVFELRRLQRVAYLESIRLMYEDQPAEAAEILHDAFRASRHLGCKGRIHERTVGASHHHIILPGWRQWMRRADVTADQIEAARRRMQEDWILTPPASDQLKVECLMQLNECQPPLAAMRDQFDSEIIGNAIKRLGLSPEATLSSLNTNVPGWQVPILWTLGEPDLTARASRLWLTHELQTCDLPTALHAQRIGWFGLCQTAPPAAGLDAPTLNERLETSYLRSMSRGSQHLFSHIRSEAARQSLLEVEMDLQVRIRRDNAVTRVSVEALLPVMTWPVDPCAPDAHPIRYRITDDGPVIWSVGWDGADQGGQIGEQIGEKDFVVAIPWPATAETKVE